MTWWPADIDSPESLCNLKNSRLAHHHTTRWSEKVTETVSADLMSSFQEAVRRTVRKLLRRYHRSTKMFDRLLDWVANLAGRSCYEGAPFFWLDLGDRGSFATTCEVAVKGSKIAVYLYPKFSPFSVLMSLSNLDGSKWILQMCCFILAFWLFCNTCIETKEFRSTTHIYTARLA